MGIIATRRCNVTACLIHHYTTTPHPQEQEHHDKKKQDDDLFQLQLLPMGLLERYRASPHQQSINTVLMLAGLLSISISIVVEGVHLIVRLRRRKGEIAGA